MVNTDFITIVNALGLKERIRIPDSETKNLFELTNIAVSGDPTPGDTDPDETNW